VNRPILLDTCAAIWAGMGESMSPDAVEALAGAADAGVPVLVSPMSAWEIGLLTARGRLLLSMPPVRWWASFLDRCGVGHAELEPDILIGSSFLPGAPPSDPADRIIAATARHYGCRLMTRDRRLLEYGAAGHIQTIGC
jgi:PIN domain nuclease of toxin-antitoxin system